MPLDTATLSRDWIADPKVSQAIHADHVCRALVEGMHEVMSSRSITVKELATHLGMDENAVRAAIIDPLQQPLHVLVRMLTTLGLTLTTTQRT